MFRSCRPRLGVLDGSEDPALPGLRAGEIPVARFLRIDPEAVLPRRAHPGDAGADLHAVTGPEGVTIGPGCRHVVRTGLRAALPEGWEMQIRPRSGLAARHGVTVLNAPGTIDAGYRGEIGVCLVNHGAEPFRIRTGDRIAQAVFARVPDIRFEEVACEDDLSKTSRGAGGFGSTGLGAPGSAD